MRLGGDNEDPDATGRVGEVERILPLGVCIIEYLEAEDGGCSRASFDGNGLTAATDMIIDSELEYCKANYKSVGVFETSDYRA